MKNRGLGDAAAVAIVAIIVFGFLTGVYMINSESLNLESLTTEKSKSETGLPIYPGAEKADHLITKDMQEPFSENIIIEAYEVETSIATVSDWYVEELNERGWVLEGKEEHSGIWMAGFRKNDEGVSISIANSEWDGSELPELSNTTIYLIRGSWDEVRG